MKRLIFVAGVAVGFVIGSRVGRGPYESLERTARQVAEDPEVQRRAAQARDTAGRVAHDAAETVKEKAPEVASGVQDAVSGAATAAKEKLSGNGAEAPSGQIPAVADASVAGGDAEVGDDKPLSS